MWRLYGILKLRGDIMDKNERQDLKLKIEELKFKLKTYISDSKDKDEVYELSKEIDELIVQFHNLDE